LKKIVSISLGSSKRDHNVNIIIKGQKINIRRIGTNGDVDKAIRLIRTRWKG